MLLGGAVLAPHLVAAQVAAVAGVQGVVVVITGRCHDGRGGRGCKRRPFDDVHQPWLYDLDIPSQEVRKRRELHVTSVCTYKMKKIRLGQRFSGKNRPFSRIHLR